MVGRVLLRETRPAKNSPYSYKTQGGAASEKSMIAVAKTQNSLLQKRAPRICTNNSKPDRTQSSLHLRGIFFRDPG